FVSLGSRAGLRPKDLVGAITAEAGISGRDIGPIDIREAVSFVGVTPEVVEQVIARMANAVIRGRRAAIVLARPQAGAPQSGSGGSAGPPPWPERDRGPRPERTAGPRPPRGPEGHVAPRKKGGPPPRSRG